MSFFPFQEIGEFHRRTGTRGHLPFHRPLILAQRFQPPARIQIALLQIKQKSKLPWRKRIATCGPAYEFAQQAAKAMEYDLQIR